MKQQEFVFNFFLDTKTWKTTCEKAIDRFSQNKRRCGPLETLGASDGFFIIVGEKSNPINGDKERESERVEAENGAFNVPLRVESSRARLNCYPILEERCCATVRSRKKDKILLFSYSRENKNHCLP